ncbi:DNA alkylation repair protein [Aeromicrobium terrae]|uniref:DNA alkylation repair protein n=1 Tax=Aeromicrobium terrae TaxID=2498846 RepID=A0A5C8NLI4_9ACTN|nr:DNA alkylation repair protein [Aeromicrobium terrae]TXL61950.1 DNA alkylation repair protein [Aeromicrobium terrae]
MDQLVSTVRAQLREQADSALAPGQQTYMKSAMPFLGVRVPQVRRLTLAAARSHPPADVEALERAARALWDEAQYREERYAATALTGLPMARGRLELMDLHEHMAVTGAWWDHVDDISHRIGATLAAHPEETARIVRRWIASDDLWLRRLSIICQLDRGADTDRALLTEAVDAAASSDEFFLRKAIGWALRQHARVDPDWVRAFVGEREDALSPLSQREALKHLR